MEGDVCAVVVGFSPDFISIHSLRMEGDWAGVTEDDFNNISIHSLRMEGDAAICTVGKMLVNFNPLPPHGGRHSPEIASYRSEGISIHSLRMEGDIPRFAFLDSSREISIHSLRMEGDVECVGQDNGENDFNPLPPHGGRRKFFGQCLLDQHYFNPLPPHGGRLVVDDRYGGMTDISIHSLRMEGDNERWRLSR